jgi:hypothetical protein
MAIICSKAFSIVVAAAGPPFAYFKCDDNVADKVAKDEISGFDLTTSNAISNWPTAKIGTAFSDPWLRLMNSPDAHWDFSATGFTVRVWISTPGVPQLNTFFILSSTGSWDLTLQWSLVPSARQFPSFRVTLTDGDHQVDGPDLTEVSNFHRVMAGWEKGVGLWIKFDNDPTITVAATANAAFAGAGEGFWLGPTNESQPMGIDEVAVWNRTLSAAEITSDWNGGAGVTYP